MTGVELLQYFDWALAGAGLVLLVGWGLFYALRWQDPLRPGCSRPNRLDALSIILVITVWLLAGSVAAVLAVELFKLPDQADSEQLAATVGVGLAQLALIPLCLIAARKWFRRGLKGLGIGRRPLAVSMGWAVGGFVVSWPLCWGLLKLSSWALQVFWPDYQLETHQVMQILHRPGINPATAVWLYVVAIVITPLWEELLFRGLGQSWLVRVLRRRWAAIIITAAIFGLVHSSQPQAVLPLIAFGLCLGFVYEKSGSLTAAILLHSLFNAKNLLWDALRFCGAT